MTLSRKDLDTGEVAAHSYLSNLLGWKENFVKSYEPRAVEVIVNTADATPGDIPAKEHAAGEALYKVIAAAGYGGQVTTTQCGALAVAVYQAVLKSRG